MLDPVSYLECLRASQSVSNSIMLDGRRSEAKSELDLVSVHCTTLGGDAPGDFGPLASLETHHVLNYTGEKDGELILGIEG